MHETVGCFLLLLLTAIICLSAPQSEKYSIVINYISAKRKQSKNEKLFFKFVDLETEEEDYF